MTLTTQVVTKIGGRVTPTAVLQVHPLDLGGVRVQISVHDQSAWVVSHRLLRELRLVGWDVVPDGGDLLVLGWSAANLTYRLNTLRVAVGGLSDCVRTVAAAQAAAESYLAALPHAAQDELVTAVRTQLETEHLRWPVRARELAGLERTSAKPLLAALLERSRELEDQVLALCRKHLEAAETSIRAVWADHVEDAPAPDLRYTAMGVPAPRSPMQPIGRAS
ncbi:hypothetical protein GCM10010156_66610 [Planobispora rosea]|uniref:Uncharacterized protein n=1 Tax=Planobispora rosea TaxID=35762 RepID=A0A8J3WFD1_PLARO|nr:hypothetical protein [Planobispora rosea]GGS99136.1 hypothetical protein GCM10010156_66610 [Planobispora rosea]GIH88024.1 hypothetical protein Pro02_64320 [Planobispora rosea]